MMMMIRKSYEFSLLIFDNEDYYDNNNEWQILSRSFPFFLHLFGTIEAPKYFHLN